MFIDKIRLFKSSRINEKLTSIKLLFHHELGFWASCTINKTSSSENNNQNYLSYGAINKLPRNLKNWKIKTANNIKYNIGIYIYIYT